jgi:hypothetical protein
MSDYQCDQCGCVENSSLGLYWDRHSDHWGPQIRGRALCSECAPVHYPDGSTTGYGKWHGRFKQRSAIGRLVDNEGHLWTAEGVAAGDVPKHLHIVQEITGASASMASRLFDVRAPGLEVLRAVLPDEELVTFNAAVASNLELFEIKREKTIPNNQRVCLLYRGPFDADALKDSIFSSIFTRYTAIRESIASESPIAFERGSSLEIKLITYPVSELGVGIHKDLSSNINVIVFFNLTGSADVQTFSDKAGSNPVNHLMRPGDVSIMRAPRSPGETDIRPYHGVMRVDEVRTVLVIREINDEFEKVANKDNWRGF